MITETCENRIIFYHNERSPSWYKTKTIISINNTDFNPGSLQRFFGNINTDVVKNIWSHIQMSYFIVNLPIQCWENTTLKFCSNNSFLRRRCLIKYFQLLNHVSVLKIKEQSSGCILGNSCSENFKSNCGGAIFS